MATGGDHDAALAQLLVGGRDGGRADAQLGGQRPHGGQRARRGQRAGADARLDELAIAAAVPPVT